MQQQPRVLEGETWRGMLAAGTAALARNVDAVNALNVFPVPDGDTGTNMLLTLRAVQEELARTPKADLDATGRAVARGALLGARGNSGVILSQFLRGLFRSLEGCTEADAARVAQAFGAGAAAAYQAVSTPVEGTILTVLRATGQAMAQAVAGTDPQLVDTLRAGLEGCRAAVLRTPEQLDVLRQAGVVDAGGQGFALVLEGGLRYLQGEDVEAVRLEMVLPSSRVQAGFLAAVESEQYGYCTQILIRGQDLDPDALRARVSTLASSTVVVGDDTLVKVHAHTHDPGPILSLGVSAGTLSEVKIENIDEQHREFQAAHRQAGTPAPLGVVAVAWGLGLEKLFRNLGAGAVLTGGQTMNPSCQELLKAVEALGAEATLVLPNNSNVIPAARQAIGLCTRSMRVVPTRSIPQGIAAMLAFNPEGDLEGNAAAMERAAASVRAGELVTAVRDAQVDGRAVRAGEIMGTLDGALAGCGLSCTAVLEAVVGHAGPTDGSLITLYWGGDTRQAEAEEAAQRLRQRHPGVEVELVHGGQPYYHYLVAIE
jgi:hypothetical protein